MEPPDDRRVKLSPIDVRMLRFGLRVLLVFPPRASRFDLVRLQQSFRQTLHDQFPLFFDGERSQDEATGELWIQRRTTQGRPTEEQFIQVEELHEPPTLDDVLQATPHEFIPARSRTQLLSLKCSLLVDGALVIGVNADHCAVDAEGLTLVLKRWSRHYLGATSSSDVRFCHDRSHLLQFTPAEPTMPHPEYGCMCHATTQSPRLAVSRALHSTTSQQRFHLSPAELQDLKALAAEGDEAPPFSTLDCVTALFTWLITRSRGHSSAVQVSTAVNLRRRLQPPLPELFTGNAVLPALSLHPASDFRGRRSRPSASVLNALAQRVRRSIAKFDDVYIRDTISLLATHREPSSLQPAVHFSSGPDVFFSSWRRIGMGDVNFGCKPMYAGPPTLSCDGVVIFLDNVANQPGLDALVFLDDQTMVALEHLWADRA